MYYATRSQITPEDIAYIAQTLGTTPGERESIVRSAADPALMTGLLREKRLFQRSMTTPPAFLTISPQLFFYVFVYRALDHKGIADDDVADYVAGICVEFRTGGALWHVASTEGGKTVYMFDLLKLLQELDRPQQYCLRRYIGNVSLFLTGFFPDFIFRRSVDAGAPPLSYYEKIGRAQFDAAAGESASYDAEAGPVLNTLAAQFVAVRSAMNLYTDAYLRLHDDRHSLNRLRRQAATLDDDSFRQSLEIP